MNFKAVLFDGYGTLFEDAMIELREVCARIIGRNGLDLTPDAFLEEWDRYFFPLLEGDFITLREVDVISLEQTFKDLEIEDTPKPYIDALFKRFNKASSYPDVGPTLAGLDGCTTGIISNADVENIEGALKVNGLQFPLVVTSESARCYKPHPDIFYRALSSLECKPAEVLYVGDSQRDDIVGAKRAGISIAWLNRQGVTRKEGVPNPDYEIRSLKDVLKIV